MGGEAESYQNVEIHFVEGMHRTLLSIYHDSIEVEQIELSALSTLKEMHQVLVDKGFVLKSAPEVAKIRKEKGKALDAEYKRAEEEYMNHLLKVERLMQQEEQAEAAKNSKSTEATNTANEPIKKFAQVDMDAVSSNRFFFCFFLAFVATTVTWLILQTRWRSSKSSKES